MLADLQRDFRRALLGGDEAAIAELVLDDGLTSGERLAVYRNNVAASLTAVLKEAFPVVCRLVDERFFDYAAHEFLRAHPPERPCLSEYGADFPAFLAGFPPSRHLVYLPDVARFEWLMHAAAYAADLAPLSPSALQGIAADDTPRLVFRFHPALGLIASPWPIDRIWRANRPGAESEEAIALDSGGAYLVVSRQGRDVVFHSLSASSFTFRRALWSGRRLGAAADAALAKDPAFDLSTEFADLFRDKAVVGFALAPVDPEESAS